MRFKILTIILCIVTSLSSGCSKTKSCLVPAAVLTINSEIVEGKLIGHFLGSSDGWLRSDVIKVGVSFEVGDHLFLEDLKLSHAQLAYYKDKRSLLLHLKFERRAIGNSGVEIRLDGYYLKRRTLSWDLAGNLIQDIKDGLGLHKNYSKNLIKHITGR